MPATTFLPDALQGLAKDAAALLDQADALVIAAGAGMGIDSGLPDFRGNEGFWAAYPALREARLDFHSIASPAAFKADPARAWGFYGHRLALYRATLPHQGFAILQRWAQQMPLGASIFTSNVDGQFQKAGFDPAGIHECHGSIHHLQCMQPCGGTIWQADSFQPQVDAGRCRLINAAPTCPACGGLARPNILMFSDWDWIGHRTQAQQKRQQAWLARVRRPVVLEIGAGSAIASVRHFSHGLVQHHGARLIRINPAECAVPTARDLGLPAGALAALLAIDRHRSPPLQP